MTDTTSGASKKASKRTGPALCSLCGRKNHGRSYRRRISERRKALLRDAADPKSGLSRNARQFIIRNDGHNVPEGYEVSHETPLYTLPRSQRCTLDHADNMKTQRKSVHRARHRQCGNQFHEFKRKKRRR